MFDTTNLDELNIENGAPEIKYAIFHFHEFRKDIQEARTYDDSDEYLKPVKQQYIECAKYQFQYYKHCLNNAYRYLGSINKETIDKLIFKYKYQQELPTAVRLRLLIVTGK